MFNSLTSDCAASRELVSGTFENFFLAIGDWIIIAKGKVEGKQWTYCSIDKIICCISFKWFSIKIFIVNWKLNLCDFIILFALLAFSAFVLLFPFLSNGRVYVYLTLGAKILGSASNANKVLIRVCRHYITGITLGQNFYFIRVKFYPLFVFIIHYSLLLLHILYLI